VGVGWWAGRMVGPVAFVGREAELSRLVGALGGVCYVGNGYPRGHGQETPEDIRHGRAAPIRTDRRVL